MSYEKTVWTAGDTITSEKLNHLEGGVEAAANRPVFDPEAISGDGDVIVVYDNKLVGVLGDTGTLTLDTEGTVVEHDIVVDYTKPIIGNNLALTVNTANEIGKVNIPTLVNGAYATDIANTTGNYTVLASADEPHNINIMVECVGGDKYNVVINNENVSYNSRDEVYRRILTLNTPTGNTITMSITDKE